MPIFNILPEFKSLHKSILTIKSFLLDKIKLDKLLVLKDLLKAKALIASRIHVLPEPFFQIIIFTLSLKSKLIFSNIRKLFSSSFLYT